LHGKRSGEWIIWRPSTATIPQRETDVARQSYVNGNLSGKYVKYGTCWSDKERKIVRHIWEEGSYRNGQRDGHWAFWAAIEDGTSRDGVNGILKGTPEPCRKLEEQDYKMGKKNGNRTKWGYGLGRDGIFMFFPLERERYRDDALNGPFLFWEPGAPFLISSSGVYLNGQQCGSTTFYRNGFERRNGVDVWRNIDHFTESHGSCGSGVVPAAR
jgi:antitoxin component YwqK of YwqJK toxin-antitoxin module